MAMAGAYVFVTGRDPNKGAETVAEIEADGGWPTPFPVKTSFLRLDVTIEEDWVQAMAVCAGAVWPPRCLGQQRGQHHKCTN